MKRYERYEESGIGLVGEVPSHWFLKRADGVLVYKKDTVTTDDLEGREVLHYSIPSVQETGEGRIEEGSTIGSNKIRVTGGEILVSKLNPRKGTVTVVEEDHPFMVCSSEFVPLDPIGCDRRFAYYLYSSEVTRLRLSSLVESATKSHQRANPADIYKMWNAFPPLDEQRRLAAYLDRKTGEIDVLIRKKQALIALLREQRTSVINRAVTKGLDPDVRMKDSGVEWLGEVQEHWRIAKLKHYLTIKSGGGINASETEGQYEVFGGNGLLGFADDFNVEGETIVIGRVGAKCGNVHHLRDKKWVSDNALVVKTEQVPRFLYYLLSSMKLNDLANQNAQPLVTGTMIKDQVAALPPPDEQLVILQFIDRRSEEVDVLVRKEQQTIVLLHELRTSLISEVVTGKIDVRGAVPVPEKVATADVGG